MEKKQKVLFVITNMDIGGVQSALTSLLWEIKDKYDVYLYAFSFTGAMKSRVPVGVTIIDSPRLMKIWGLSQRQAGELGKGTYLLRGFTALFSKCFSNVPPIWISQRMQKKLKGFDYAISYRQNDPSNSMYSGCHEFVLNRVDAGQKIAFLHCDYQNLGLDLDRYYRQLKQMDKIVCVSRGCLKNFLNVHPEFADKSYYTYNCYDFAEIIHKSTLDQPEYDSDAINLVIAARIAKEKGIDRAVRVVTRLTKEGYKLALHIVGDGCEMGKIARMVEEHQAASYIKLHGSKDNPYPYIANADLLLLSSYHEAAPMVIGEAKALKTPVLTTENPSAGEQVKIGQEGFICKNDEQGIYDVLKMLLDHPHLLSGCKAYLNKCTYTNQDALNQFEEMMAAPVAVPGYRCIAQHHESRLNHG